MSWMCTAETRRTLILAAALLLTGSLNTLAKKAQNNSRALGKDNDKLLAKAHTFNHPWFQTSLLFAGELLWLLACLLYRYRQRQRHDVTQALLAHDFQAAVSIQDDCPTDTFQDTASFFQPVIVLPAFCELLGTSLTGVGLVYVNASVWQMLRGSILVFTAFLSVAFLKRKFQCVQLGGIALVVVGLALVGTSAIFRGKAAETGRTKTIIGIMCILAGQLMRATQMVIEERFLKKRQLHPLHVVSLEGLFGLTMMAMVILPAMYFVRVDGKRYEDSLDALAMIGQNSTLLIFCVVYTLSIASYKLLALTVAKKLTAVHRTMVDTCRSIVVWSVQLMVFYAGAPDYGEKWDVSYGPLQVDGFLFIVGGLLMFNKIVQLEYFRYVCC